MWNRFSLQPVFSLFAIRRWSDNQGDRERATCRGRKREVLSESRMREIRLSGSMSGGCGNGAAFRPPRHPSTLLNDVANMITLITFNHSQNSPLLWDCLAQMITSPPTQRCSPLSVFSPGSPDQPTGRDGDDAADQQHAGE